MENIDELVAKHVECVEDAPKTSVEEIISNAVKAGIALGRREGYLKRVSEEYVAERDPEKWLKMNDFYWMRYNYGASGISDNIYFYFAGSPKMYQGSPRYRDLTYDEASNIPFLTLPTKSEFLALYNSTNHKFEYDQSSSGNRYNMRIELLDRKTGDFLMSFYGYSPRIWLRDEVSEYEALVVDMNYDSSKRTIELEFRAVDKKEKNAAHFYLDNDNKNKQKKAENKCKLIKWD